MEVTSGQIQVTLSPNTTYDVSMVDQNDLTVTSTTGTSNVSGVLTIPLPEKYTRYDGWFALEISNGGNVVYMDSVTSTRPFVTAQQIIDYMDGKVTTTAEAIELERAARYQIEAIIGFSFDYARRELHLVGNGTDFLPSHERITKVYSVKENNQTIWSDGEGYAFKPFVGFNSVVRDAEDDSDNRLEYKVVWNNRYAAPEFKENYDYVVDAEVGWQVIPQDIQEATLMLVNDIVCGNNRYSNKYIRSVDTGAMSFDYYKDVVGGTGNLMVDNILSKYVLESVRARVL